MIGNRIADSPFLRRSSPKGILDDRELVVGALYTDLLVNLSNETRSELSDKRHDGIEAFLKMTVGVNKAAQRSRVAPGLLIFRKNLGCRLARDLGYLVLNLSAAGRQRGNQRR